MNSVHQDLELAELSSCYLNCYHILEPMLGEVLKKMLVKDQRIEGQHPHNSDQNSFFCDLVDSRKAAQQVLQVD
jgi:hypothetical protein